MLQRIKTLPSFTAGVMTATLITSAILNLAFYRGTLHSPEGAYCEGFYAGAQNAIIGETRSLKR